MAGKAEFDAVVARLNSATNTLAAKLTDIKTKLAEALANAGALGTEEDATLAELGTIATTLEGLGADPANPVPEEPTPTDPNA